MRKSAQTISLFLLTFAAVSTTAGPLKTFIPMTESTLGVQGKPLSLYEQGLIALDKRQLAEAEKLFKQASGQEPSSPAPLLGLAEVARISGKEAEVERWIRKTVEIAPNHGDSQMAMGRLLYAKGKYDQAEQYLIKASTASPNSPSPLLDLGELYLNALRKPDHAAQAFLKVLKLNQEHAGAYFGLGNSYLALRDYSNAVQSLTTATRLAPDNPLAFIGLSDALSAKGDARGAFAALQEAAKFAPKAASIPLKRGMLYQQNGQWKEAMAEYEQTIRLDNGLALAYNNLAWLAAEQNTRLDEGAHWAAKAVELAPKNVSFKDTLAWVKRAKGDRKGAHDLLESIAKTSNPSAEALYHLGIVKAEAGQKAEAITALKRALQIDPKFPQAQDINQRIKQLEGR